RQALGKITREGVYLEELEHNPAKYLPEVDASKLGGEVVHIDLRRPMKEILAQLTRYPIKTRLSLGGPMIVARDLAHAKLRERLESGKGLPDYFKNHPVYYAGPAKTPEGYASGSFGPTTAGRMDSFVDAFQAAGGSMVMLAKGNRSPVVRDACKKYGGFYLASIGGAAANLAEHCIKKVEVREYPELGMEAIWSIEVVDFPAFIVIDDKGNDFFKELNLGWGGRIACSRIIHRCAMRSPGGCSWPVLRPAQSLRRALPRPRSRRRAKKGRASGSTSIRRSSTTPMTRRSTLPMPRSCTSGAWPTVKR